MSVELSPRVSLIVPVANGERTLPALLGSLRQLDYPADRLEVFLVDNNSCDRTPELIREAGFVVLSETDIQSSYAARNRGLAAATGEILGFTDADCVVDALWVREAVGAFARPEVGAVAGKTVGYDPTNFVEKYLVDSDYFNPEYTLRHPFLPYAPTANVFYRREVFEKVGRFRPEWPSGGDADLAWRMQLETGFKLEFCAAALVKHIHRSTLRALYDQNFFWGQGGACLYAAYAPKWRRSAAERRREYRELAAGLVKAFLALARGRREAPEVVEAMIRAGRKLGQIRGTIRYGGGHW